MPANHIRRRDLWPYIEDTYGEMPLSEYRRMGGDYGMRMARNHRDPRITIPRVAAISLLGELEIDRTHPSWGCHMAALEGDPDAMQQPEYRGAKDLPTAKRLHAAAVKQNGERILRELGL